MLTTALTRLLGIEHPIIQAGMGSLAGARLAAAVSNAGGLGTVGTIGRRPSEIHAELEAARAATNKPFSANIATFVWAPFADSVVDITLKAEVPVITLSFGATIAAVERCKDAGRTA